EYQGKKDLETALKAKIDKFNKKRDSISKAFQLEYGQAEAKSKGLSQKAAQELAKNLNEKGQFLGQQLQLEEQQLQAESQAKTDTLLKEIRAFVKDYGKQYQYTYILGSNEAGSVMYGDETKDITEELLNALNEAYKKKE
ncbi:MAG: OmpH family outer membrane protein, partial [Bacteroidota bacterium]